MLTLAQVKSTFSAMVKRPQTVTDSFVSGIVRMAQLEIVTKGYFSWTLVANDTDKFDTVIDKAEYKLSDLNPTWCLRRLESVFVKQDTNNNAGGLTELSLRTERLHAPDPKEQFGSGIPEYFYVKDNGKTINLFPVPDAVYLVYVDYYRYPDDPVVSGNMLIPEEFEDVLILKLFSLWHRANEQAEKEALSDVKLRKRIKEMLSDDNNKTRGFRRPIVKHGTNSRRRRHSMYSESDFDRYFGT